MEREGSNGGRGGLVGITGKEKRELLEGWKEIIKSERFKDSRGSGACTKEVSSI